MLRERALRTALLCCSPAPPRLFTESKRATLVSTEPCETRLQPAAAALCASAAVFSTHFHSPCGCFDAFAAPWGGGGWVGGCTEGRAACPRSTFR